MSEACCWLTRLIDFLTLAYGTHLNCLTSG